MEKKKEEIQICRPNDLSDEIRYELASAQDHFCLKDDRIYLQIDQSVFCFPNSPASKELVFTINNKFGSKCQKPCSYKEVLEKILKDPNYQPDSAILRTYGVRLNSRRCAAVLRAYSPIETDLCSLISSMAPLERGDAMISVDYQTAVYVKDLDHQSIEEMQEFVDAMIGTMETEGIVDIRAGIGCECDDINGIRRSFDEGNEAIQTGIRFHRHDHVFVYFSGPEGFAKDAFSLNPREVAEAEWIRIGDLAAWLERSPDDFTAWFRPAYALAEELLKEQLEV